MATRETEFVDYYTLLGVQPSSTLTEIRKAFITKAKQHHPDAGGATDTMQLLNKAYKTLVNSSSKASYDLLHNFQTGATEIADYKYEGGQSHNKVEDMSDADIDSFLDSVFEEYRHGAPKAPKQSVKQRFKSMFGLDIE